MSVNSGGPPFMLPPPRPPPPAAHMPQPPGHLMAGGVMPLGLPPGPAGAAAILVQMNKEHRLSNIPLIDSSLVQINKEHHLSSIPLTDSSLVQIKSEPSDLEFKPELNFNEHNEHDEHDNEHDHENQLIANGLLEALKTNLLGSQEMAINSAKTYKLLSKIEFKNHDIIYQQ